MQKEITSRTPLLTADGDLAVCGWARRNLFDYDRTLVKKRGRLKEWDFYQVSDGSILVQINFFNITLASAATAAVIDMKTGERIECADITLCTRRKYLLPEVSDTPNVFEYERGISVCVSRPRRPRAGSRFRARRRASRSRRISPCTSHPATRTSP